MTDAIFDMERAVLGTLIEKPSEIVETLARLPPHEWSGPHQIITESLQGMVDLGEEVTPYTLMQRLRSAGVLNRVGGAAMIHTLMQIGYSAGASSLVEALESEVIRRRARYVGMQLQQRADNPTIEPEEIITEAIDSLGSIGHVGGQIETIGWPSEEEENEDVDWVIPHLLAADERVMITGGEGLGKSMLIRQLVCSVVVGYHPFLAATFDSGPALHIDLENPRHVSDRAYRLIRNGLRRDGIAINDQLHRLEPRQFDVCDAHDVAWLMRAVRAIQPRLIAIGPMKNMTTEDLNEEKAAVRVHNVLNRIRAETRSVLIVEGHAGHGSRGTDGDWRPRGSSSFLGWPEFGFGMKPITTEMYRAAQLVPWRGARSDERYWPEWLAQGTTWPWSEDPRIERN